MSSYDAYGAMLFAREKHKDQVRKYTGNPYSDHLAEVAGIVATVAPFGSMSLIISVAWLHDCVEDCDVTGEEIKSLFGVEVAQGVMALSDLEQGSRSERKAASSERLSQADGWIQTIKCADLISNTSSIVMHDPKFAAVYLEEKRQLLSVLTKADRRLHSLASDMCSA
jgi:GTP diphosphokinase / guanosine-3',5'-bis(diphosphate) 3'-diphosphatase